MKVKIFQIDEIDDGLRLDRWFHRNIPSMPFTVVAKLTKKGQIRLDGKRVKINSRIKYNQKIRTPIMEFKKQIKQPNIIIHNFYNIKKEILNSVIFEDDHLLVLNKPYGICVQGGTKVKISIDRIFKISNADVKIVHRIDKETTGLLLLAKNAFVADQISQLFREKKVIKKYLAVLCKIPHKSNGVIESIIMSGNKYMQKEQFAQTKFRIIAKHEKLLSLVEMVPFTGRKHQIRIHSEKINCPILGDSKYKFLNNKNELYNNKYLHLHSYYLNFKLFGKAYNLCAKLPRYFLDTIKKYFNKELKYHDF